MRLSIQWGPWSGDGMASGKSNRFDSVGIGMLDPTNALNVIARLLKRGQSGVIAVANNDWSKIRTQARPRQKSWFDSIIPKESISPADLLWVKLKKLSAQLGI